MSEDEHPPDLQSSAILSLTEQRNAAFIPQALNEAGSLHIVPRGGNFARKEPARQRLVEHLCTPDAVLGEVQMPPSRCGVLIEELPPVHIVRGPRDIGGRCPTVLDFEIAPFLGV
ncbi:hypothetical protein ONZ43_g1542 [Nemania bipapillata]|uniref:Uncharacterized protein n=1 Tax=Nemania bipapillata TaxID=110536 RepID=A0ACC2J478_9PEZI|nr:hypothetical protein ONZ43_g1542 [Nemania bipapillata]